MRREDDFSPHFYLSRNINAPPRTYSVRVTQYVVSKIGGKREGESYYVIAAERSVTWQSRHLVIPLCTFCDSKGHLCPWESHPPLQPPLCKGRCPTKVGRRDCFFIALRTFYICKVSKATVAISSSNVIAKPLGCGNLNQQCHCEAVRLWQSQSTMSLRPVHFALAK